MRIELFVSRAQQRKWYEVLAQCLRDLPGVEVRVHLTDDAKTPGYRRLQRLLWLERRLHHLDPGGLGLGALHATPTDPHPFEPDITIDLTAQPLAGRWSVRYDGRPGEQAAVDALRSGHLPLVSIVDETGSERATGRPGSEVPGLFSTALADLSVGVSTLLVGAISGKKFALPDPGASSPKSPRSHTEIGLRRVAGAAIRVAYRVGFRSPHWRVGWRAAGDADALTTGRLTGAPWADVADDGHRFYADPFPFDRGGRTYLFVEDFDHRTGKGVISVAPWDEHGQTEEFTPVLMHDVHLSYPFVLEHAGEVWMIPETSGAGRIELYRAVEFPHAWELHSVLVDGVVASDATPFMHADRWWLTATVGLGGSLSDSLYVWSAPDLLGPWTEHTNNPVLIDIASARPAGRVELRDGRLLRPVQDGRKGYGAAISVAEITRLDDDAFAQTIVARYASGAAWPGTRVHTLNRSGGIEVIDGSRLSPRLRRPRRR